MSIRIGVSIEAFRNRIIGAMPKESLHKVPDYQFRTYEDDFEWLFPLGDDILMFSVWMIPETEAVRVTAELNRAIVAQIELDFIGNATYGRIAEFISGRLQMERQNR